jgi:hypothetical protein
MKSRMSISIIPDFLGFTLTKFMTYPDAVPLSTEHSRHQSNWERSQPI